ncbi:MAG: hypothetical protein MRY72_10030 [Aquisalinus sp.]|nr:hypothetical protein [Aquisalinus sp.]
MSFQTFTASSLEEAKQVMRSALGADAVILASKKRPDGKVEIRAIKKGVPLFEGEGPANFARPAPAKPTSSLASRTRAGKEAPQQNRSVEGSGLHARVERSASTSALSRLKGDFSSKLQGNRADTTDPIQKELADKLKPQGISPQLIKALAVEARNAPEKDLTAMLEYAFARVLRFAPLTLSKDVPIMLMGQTGAGKTSSAAKLAARAAGMGARAAFLCADIGRAGALDQMTTYAEALDTRFWPIEDPQDVIDVMRNEKPDDILILDTPGVSPFAPADIIAMEAFRDSLQAEPLLVLPASGDMHEHIDWANAFRDIGVRRCIITKFDTSRRIGAAVSAAFESNLALAHFSEAPFIADGLIDANPAYLAHRLLMKDPARIGASVA